MAVVALWMAGGERASALRRHLWLGLLGGAVGSALIAGIARPLALLWIGGFAGAAFVFYRAHTSRWLRLTAAAAIVVLATGLMLHRLPGFENPRVLDGVQFSRDSIPFRLHLNFDKTIIGLFVLGFGHTRLASRDEWRRMLRLAAPVAGCTIGLVLLGSLALGYVRFDPKVPAAAALWLWVNLCFTCFVEESLFRGFLQAQLQRAWAGTRGGAIAAVLVAAVVFGAAHAGGGPSYVALATLAGAGYGWAFQRTGRIEAAILCHFALNTTHFFLFSYPALLPAA